MANNIVLQLKPFKKESSIYLFIYCSQNALNPENVPICIKVNKVVIVIRSGDTFEQITRFQGLRHKTSTPPLPSVTSGNLPEGTPSWHP